MIAIKAFIALCICLVLVSSSDAQQVVVEFVDAEQLDFRIRVRNADGSKLPGETAVNVWLSSANKKTDPSIFGKVTSEGGQILFAPRFPFQRGKSYTIVVVGDGEVKTSELLDVPAKESKRTAIDSLYPSADEIPENLLRFYVQFSAPMRKGDIYSHIRILNENGDEIELPFLEIEQELWSRDSTRLTLLLDPGRFKRGLKPREEMGPILVSGQEYSLVIDGKWKDANGQSIGKDVVKRFLAVSEDHVQPDPSSWKVSVPKSGSKEVLTVTFDGSIDWSMLFRSITLLDSDARTVAGSISVSEHETVWTFTPEQVWEKGSYTISVDPSLEDAAGNSVGRQFDVDVFEKTESSNDGTISSISFSIDE